jgi:enterochelin esterase-like enzyme
MDNGEKISSFQVPTSESVVGKLFRVEDFPSKYITPRNVDVWLPENYSSSKKYAVLYMHDGQMLFDSTTTWNQQEWKVDEWATKLMDEGKTKDFIVVAPWNINNERHSDFFPQKPFESLPQKTQDSLFKVAKKEKLPFEKINSDNYLKFLVKELKPYIDKAYITLTDKNNTAVMGSSMGGLISMYAISEYPEIYGGAACLSTHWIGTFTDENNPIPEAFFEYMEAHLPDASSHTLYFDYGTATLDALYLPYQTRVNAVLAKKGFNTNIRFENADHSENSWNSRLDVPLTFLFGYIND